MNNGRRAIPVKWAWKAAEKPEQTTYQRGNRRDAEEEKGRKEKTRRFRKELKTFLRDILLIEPLCPAPTLLPFRPSPIRSLSLSLSFQHLSPSHTPRYNLHPPLQRVSVYTCLSFTPSYSIFIHFYPFTYLFRSDSNLPGSVVYCQREKRRKMAARKAVARQRL